MTQQEQRKHWTGIEASPITFTSVHPQRQIAYDEQLEDESLYTTRLHTSARRYTTDEPKQHTVSRPHRQAVKKPDRYDEVNVYIRRRPRSQGNGLRQNAQTMTQERERRATRRAEPETPDQEEEPRTQPPSQRRPRAQTSRFTCLTWVGLGMIAALLLWIVCALLLNWWNSYQDDLHYGRPRTYQTDARVGHNDANTPSHFLAVNLNEHIDVLEFPGGDATHAKVYQGPTLSGQGSTLDIVTLSFKDVNGDGKPDMIITVKDAHYPLINDNGAFRPPHADEHVNM